MIVPGRTLTIVYPGITISACRTAMLSVAVILAGIRNGAAGEEVPAGNWRDGSPVHQLSGPHILGAATLLSDGKVLVAGGLGGFHSPDAVRTAELYDPQSNSWSVTGSLKAGRWSLDAITLGNGKALFAGGSSGFSPDGALATAELYDPQTGEFSETENTLSSARHSSGISRLNDGRILITGGNSKGNSLAGSGETSVDIYDPATNLFRPVAAMHQGRSLHAQLTLTDGRVLVVGGAQKDAEIYDPVADSWTASTGSLPSTLKDMKAFELWDGRIFIAGGQNTVDGLTTDATWFFDLKTTEFTEGPGMQGFNYNASGPQVGVSDYSAFDLFPHPHVLKGRYIIIAGGEHDPPTGPDVELNSAAVYDARAGRWINVGPMPFVHDDHTESALSVNSAGNPELLLFGGNQTSRTSRFEFQFESVSAD